MGLVVLTPEQSAHAGCEPVIRFCIDTAAVVPVAVISPVTVVA